MQEMLVDALPRPLDRGAYLYLDLMKRCLMNTIYGDTEMSPVIGHTFIKRRLVKGLMALGLAMVRSRPLNERERLGGNIITMQAHTFIGQKRLENLQYCIESALAAGVPGDLIEAGVCRGGATIFMRAVLKAHGVIDRLIWVADSFAGLPTPDADRYPLDADLKLHEIPYLAVSLEQVQRNFAAYGLLDDQVRFLKGWFKDTLPGAPIASLAVLRLDGDMYESTMDTLTSLYPKLSPGGYVILDDFGAFAACRQAVYDYRSRYQISEEILAVDNTCVYWQRSV